VIAYPWRRRTAAEAFGHEVADLIDVAFASRKPIAKLVSEAAARLARVAPGPSPSVPDPTIPVIAVTGTNGKTSTVRLIAHIVREAGRSVAFSSTDGVYLNDALVEHGDYSGFGGAARAMSQPGVEVAVLETARGGILLRGIGALHNDVAVVTNVSADHLDLHGIRTIDQLAEVKSTITRITRPKGWDVLNADDPRVLAMRKGARGRPWLISLDRDHPALRQVLDEGGKAMTVVDRQMTLLEPGRDPRPLVRMEEIPITLAGISSHNVQNAMGAAAAALGIGLPEEDVVRGLRTFVLDPESNPGLCAPGSEVWITFGTAGDRSDDILHALAYTAARGSDHVSIVEFQRYLRGRDRDDLIARLSAGCVDGGASRVPVYANELRAIGTMLRRSKRRDVLAVTALAQRGEVFAYLRAKHARRIGPARVRQLVLRARPA
jgi:cyanophycin synthetase